MRAIRESKMLVVLAAGGVLLRLLTRGRASQSPVERKHMTGNQSGGAPKSSGWASGAATPAVPKSGAVDDRHLRSRVEWRRTQSGVWRRYARG
jgi:hypothetical protein